MAGLNLINLFHLFGNSFSCRSLPLSHLRQIRLLCTSLLEAAAAAYGCVLQNAKLEKKPICNFIPKPCVYRMEQIAGLTKGLAERGQQRRHPSAAPENGGVNLLEKD